MNSYDLFDAIGETSVEKVLHIEQPQAPRLRKTLRVIAAVAAAAALLAASALAVNAATGGALFGRLRVWINGELVTEREGNSSLIACGTYGVSGGQETIDAAGMLAAGDAQELIAAQNGDTQEVLSIERSSTDASETFLGFQMQVNRVEEVDGRILLHCGDDEIDLTEPLRSDDECRIDYTIKWNNGSVTRLLITVSRNTDGAYTVSTEPQK